MATTGSTSVPTTGNDLQAPPRLTGDPKTDQDPMQRWMEHLYDVLAKSSNVTGSLTDLRARVAALEKRTPTTTTTTSSAS